MFKPDKKTRKLLKQNRIDTWAYVYPDGVVIRHNERHTHKGKEFSDEKTIKIPCDMRVGMNSKLEQDQFEYNPEHYDGLRVPLFVGRLVFHNATLLIDGIERIEVYRDTGSDASKEMGIKMDSVHIYTLSGMVITEYMFPWLSSSVTIQNGLKDGKPQTVESWA